MATTRTVNLRVMVDANVLVAGVGWPRFPHEVLQHAISGDYQLVLSPFVIAEARKHILRLFPQVMDYFDAILVATNYEEVPTPSKADLTAQTGLVRDQNDVPVALAAINAGVDYLVSSDKDLTDPGESIHEHVNVLLPGAFLRQHMGWTSDQLEAIRQRNWDDLER
jgi:predicted nucleic acid-binding protein